MLGSIPSVLVLNGLTQKPFKPLARCVLHLLAWKGAFLMARCVDKRGL